MIKMIASDLDGTLLNSRKEIPSGFCQAVRELYRHGIRFVLASGREYKSILRNFPELEKILIVISDNGALNYDGGKLIGDNSLSAQQLSRVYRTMAALPDVEVVLSGEFFGYYRKDPDPVLAEELLQLSGSGETDVGIYRAAEDPLLAASKERIGKVAFFHRDRAWEVSRKALEPFMEEFQIFPSEPSWVNLMKKGVDKGLGMRQIRRYLRCTPEECMAFGDYLNDCSMFREAKHTYAMANAHPDLKKMAEHIAPSHDEEGVMRVLYDTMDFLHGV